ncbi:MAG: hypothetical protein IJC81_01910 [Clostridia bacterium]|nr:hypothetical protein [Clostridia bacterium]
MEKYVITKWGFGVVICEIIVEKIKTYGFRFYDENSGETVCTVNDVFTEADKAESFKNAINESGIDALHIQDIIDDIL